ncbi:MAG: tetratricopeptide repeat protein, partial [Alphaproteobacteria bacterium]
MTEGIVGTVDEVFRAAAEMHRADRLEDASDAYRRILREHPDHFRALLMLGTIIMDAGRNGEAFELLDRSAVLAPQWSLPHLLRGQCLHRLGRLEEAAESMRRSITLEPNHVDAYFLLGTVLSDRGLFTEAVDTFRQVLRRNPSHLPTLVNLGGALDALGDQEGAVACLERALSLEPGMAEAWGALSGIRLQQGRVDEATALVRRALELRPDMAVFHMTLGNALGTAGRLDEAYTAYRRALELRPEYDEAHSNLILLNNFDPAHTAQSQQTERRAWYQRVAARLKGPIPAHTNPPDPERRLRVGYVTADFRNHSAAFLFGPVMRHHDRDRFEVVCYSGVMIEDAMTRGFKEQASLWRHTVGVSDEDMAEQIRRDGIDILVDLSGHTI